MEHLSQRLVVCETDVGEGQPRTPRRRVRHHRRCYPRRGRGQESARGPVLRASGRRDLGAGCIGTAAALASHNVTLHIVPGGASWSLHYGRRRRELEIQGVVRQELRRTRCCSPRLARWLLRGGPLRGRAPATCGRLPRRTGAPQLPGRCGRREDDLPHGRAVPCPARPPPGAGRAEPPGEPRPVGARLTVRHAPRTHICRRTLRGRR